MADITFNGMTMEFDIVSALMDEEIKASVMESLGACSEQQLLDTYMEAHKQKFGKAFLNSE